MGTAVDPSDLPAIRRARHILSHDLDALADDLDAIPDLEPRGSAGAWIGFAERILRSARLLRDALSPPLARRRLSLTELLALSACRRAPAGGVPQARLVCVLGVSPAQVSAQLEKLRREGLLEGRRSQADRRRQCWRATAAGQKLLEAVLADLAEWASRLDERLGGKARAELIRLTDRLVSVLCTPDGDPPSSRPVLRAFPPHATPFGRHREGADR